MFMLVLVMFVAEVRMIVIVLCVLCVGAYVCYGLLYEDSYSTCSRADRVRVMCTCLQVELIFE